MIKVNRLRLGPTALCCPHFGGDWTCKVVADGWGSQSYSSCSLFKNKISWLRKKEEKTYRGLRRISNASWVPARHTWCWRRWRCWSSFVVVQVEAEVGIGEIVRICAAQSSSIRLQSGTTDVDWHIRLSNTLFNFVLSGQRRWKDIIWCIP